METDNTFTELVAASFTQINDQVFCSLVDIGITPGDAYQIAFVDIPLEDIELEIYPELNLSEDFDDVALADL